MAISKLIIPASKEETRLIAEHMDSYNFNQVGPLIPELTIRLDFVAKDAQEKVIGGIVAALGYWAGLEVQIL